MAAGCASFNFRSGRSHGGVGPAHKDIRDSDLPVPVFSESTALRAHWQIPSWFFGGFAISKLESIVAEQILGLARSSRRRWWRRLDRWFHEPESRIDHRLRVEVGGDVVDQFVVSQKDLPAYRFVDTYRAIDRAVAGFPG